MYAYVPWTTTWKDDLQHMGDDPHAPMIQLVLKKYIYF